MPRRPRLATIFLATSVAILLLPLGGVVLLRLYESALVRRTESELIAQGALAVAIYRDALRSELQRAGINASDFGQPADPLLLEQLRIRSREPFHPLAATLDLAVDPILPPPETGRAPDHPAPAVAVAAGARLTPLLVETQTITLAGLRLLDPNGVVVGSSRSEEGLTLATRDEVRRALRGEVVRGMRQRIRDSPLTPLDSISRSAHLRVHVVLPVIEQDRVLGAVLLSRTPMTVAESLYGIRWWLAAGAGSLLAVAFALSALTSRAVTRPVAELIRRTERIRAGDRSATKPLEHPGTHEIAQLSLAFSRMATALEARAAYITGFAASVSHEFKTPLASMRGSIELLREHFDGMTAAERTRFLSNLDSDVSRLDRLVRGLLELARADVLTPGDSRTAVAPVLTEIAARDPGPSELACPDTTVTARISPEALAAVVSNLVDNARRHGGATARITIRAAAATLAGLPGVDIEVADDGPGVSPANLTRVFEPFFTTARDRGGTGLGLAVVRSLLSAYSGTIGIQSEPGRTVLRVWLPS